MKRLAYPYSQLHPWITGSPVIVTCRLSAHPRIGTIANATISGSRISKDVSLQVEADLQLARLLAGLHSHQARREVSEKASQIQEAGVQLLLPEDRLYAMMEAAQVWGSKSYDISMMFINNNNNNSCTPCSHKTSLQTHSISEYSQSFQCLGSTHSALLCMGAIAFLWIQLSIALAIIGLYIQT